MPDQQPTIGRIVHFKTPNGVAPAIITHVHDEEDPLSGVALQVFDAFGGSYGMMGIQAGEEIGQWYWPPKVKEK